VESWGAEGRVRDDKERDMHQRVEKGVTVGVKSKTKGKKGQKFLRKKKICRSR